MRKFIPLVAVATLGLAACGGDVDTDADGVAVTVNGITDTGTVYVALQNEGIFGSAGATYGATAEPNGMSATVVISGVDAGDYAIAAFQDTNGNGQMDVGANGIPTEPWALSNGAGTRGAPTFGDAMMAFDGMDDTVTVTLK